MRSGRHFFQSDAPLTDLAETEVRDTDLAALVGCTARYVRKLAQDGVIERAGRNTFKLGSISTIIQHLHRAQGTAAQLGAERVRKLKAEATLAELQLAKERGEVAPLEEITRAWERATAQIRARMMQIPQRAVVQLVGESDETKIKAVLMGEIKLALTEASDPEISEADLDEDDAKHAEIEQSR